MMHTNIACQTKAIALNINIRQSNYIQSDGSKGSVYSQIYGTGLLWRIRVGAICITSLCSYEEDTQRATLLSTVN